MDSFSRLTSRGMTILSMSVLFVLVSGCNENAKTSSTTKNSIKPESKVVKQKESNFSYKLLSSKETGVTFINKLPETPEINILTYQYFHNGGGVAVGDINNDGLPDIYFSSNLFPNELYLNKGDFKFENINPIAKTTGDRGWATGVTMVDVNNDGLLDIYVCKSGKVDLDMRRNRLYINEGNLKFSEQSAKFGLDDPSYSTQAYFLDYDRDGDLDMYLLNHSIAPIKPKSGNVHLEFERDLYAGDKFFENKDGMYVDVSEKANIKGSPIGFGLSVSVGDVNQDGYPDLYVCNDYLERDYLYINNRNKGFVDELKTRTNHISNFSMGSDIADINNDGYLDFMVVDMAAKDNYRSKANMSGMDQALFEKYVEEGLHYQYMINTLQVNKGDGSFSEMAQLAGVDKTDWSWSALFMDVNHDGNRDLFVTNGLRKEARNNDFVKRKKALIAEMKNHPQDQIQYLKKIIDDMPSQKISNLIYENDGALKMKDVSHSGLETPSFSNGAAYGDFDGDGDLDLVVNNIDHEAFVYQNNTESKNHLEISFKGTKNNVNGIGSRVKVVTSKGSQIGEHYLTRGYQSSSYNKMHFGIGNSKTVDSVIVEWGNGESSVYTQVAANQTLLVEEQNSSSSLASVNVINAQMKVSVSELPFSHIENEFDDFSREVLLPHKMSQLGPALATGDVNGDGLDDFYVGGAKGQTGRLFIQSPDGGFSKTNSIVVQSNKMIEENVCEFVDIDGDGDLDIFIGAGGNDSEPEELQNFLFVNDNGKFNEAADALPNDRKMSTGTFAFNDFDKDGDVDVFIGNRQTPGKYPETSESCLLENQNGKFVDVTHQIAPELIMAGMVSTAKWANVSGDEQKELILAGEWMPIRVFEMRNAKYTDVASELGLNQTEGWWYKLELADLDKDGDLDIVAGNLGLNYKYKATPDYPFGLFYGDLNKDGNCDIVLSYEQDGEYFPLRGKQCSSQQMPELSQKFTSYDMFAKSTITDVYKGQLDSNKLLLVHDFSSAMFVNEGGKFVRKNFNHDQQYFNWSDFELIDVNMDGNIDIVAGGNLFEAEVETPRGDAGNGMVLIGDGQGNFKKVRSSLNNWGNSNVKNLAKIKVNAKEAILVGASNSVLTLVEF